MGRSYQEIIARREFEKTNCTRCGAPLEDGECGHCSPTRAILRERERILREEREYNHAMTEVPVVQNQPVPLPTDSVDMDRAMSDILGVGLLIFAVIFVVAGLCVGFNRLFM